MLIRDLRTTHNSLRDVDSLLSMIDFVQNGNVFSIDKVRQFQSERVTSSNLIVINKFEDGNLYIHDGHHRVTAIFLAGRLNLCDSEFKITQMTYEQYAQVNWDMGYHTPFDPRTEVRKPDFHSFKSLVKDLVLRDKSLAFEYIKSRADLYKEPRLLWTIEEMAYHCLFEAEKEN